jgi:hypothetical protein
VLARLRNLEDKTIQILNNMPITIDLKGSFGYNEGLAEGISKGKELVKLLGEFVTITYIVENELKMLSRLLDKQLNFQLITSLSTIPEDILLAITQVYTPEKMKKLLAAIRKARHKSSLEAGQLAVVQAFVRYGVPEALAREYLTWKKSTL